jgi:putative flippase GtrA
MPFGRFAKFVVVGGVGFVIDAGVLTLALRELTSSVYAARALFVFDGGRRTSLVAEYGRYILTQVAGALCNLGVFVALVEMIPRLAATPVVPLAIGAVLGALVNYAGSALWVFGAKRSGS